MSATLTQDDGFLRGGRRLSGVSKKVAGYQPTSTAYSSNARRLAWAAAVNKMAFAVTIFLSRQHIVIVESSFLENGHSSQGRWSGWAS